jgi:hypothetical protein
METESTVSSLDLLPLLPTMEPRMNALITSYAPPALSLETKVQAPRTAPAGKQRNPKHNEDTGHAHDEPSSAAQISFALEFERAKTKVLAHEVQKLRQSVVAHRQQQEAIDEHQYHHQHHVQPHQQQQHHSPQQHHHQHHSPPPRAASRPPPHFSPPKLQQATSPIKLTPESMARTRLIAEARVTAKRHAVDTQDRITGTAQRIFDWRDPEFIRRKVMLETNLALVKYRVGNKHGNVAGRKRSRKQANNDYHASSSFVRDMSKSLREQRWSNAGGDARSTEIPDYDVTTGTYIVLLLLVTLFF